MITRQVALCDAERLKLGVTVFVTIRTSRHSDDWTRQFIEGTRDIPEIVEIYRMTGDIDYLLKIVVPDIKAYDAVYKRLIRVADLSDVSAGFAMEVIKHTTALPLEHLQQPNDQ
ncbi:Leucine-responsive regulatory protein [compost metagenome]